MRKTIFAAMLLTTLTTAAVTSGALADRPAAEAGQKVLSGVVNINTATVQEIARLPGVGDAVAIRIVERRLQMPFSKPEELTSVKGIGAAKYEKIRPFISVTGKTTFGAVPAPSAKKASREAKEAKSEIREGNVQGVTGQLAPAALDSIAYV